MITVKILRFLIYIGEAYNFIDNHFTLKHARRYENFASKFFCLGAIRHRQFDHVEAPGRYFSASTIHPPPLQSATQGNLP